MYRISCSNLSFDCTASIFTTLALPRLFVNNSYTEFHENPTNGLIAHSTRLRTDRRPRYHEMEPPLCLWITILLTVGAERWRSHTELRFLLEPALPWGPRHDASGHVPAPYPCHSDANITDHLQQPSHATLHACATGVGVDGDAISFTLRPIYF